MVHFQANPFAVTVWWVDPCWLPEAHHSLAPTPKLETGTSRGAYKTVSYFSFLSLKTVPLYFFFFLHFVKYVFPCIPPDFPWVYLCPAVGTLQASRTVHVWHGKELLTSPLTTKSFSYTPHARWPCRCGSPMLEASWFCVQTWWQGHWHKELQHSI